MDTLVLTRHFEPYDRISWKRAIVLVLNGIAEAIEWYDAIIWRSLDRVIHMPSVVRILNEVKRRRGIRSRDSVYLRDQGRCQYCGEKVARSASTLDHVVPRSRGGRTTWVNIVTACFGCNQKKRDKTPLEAGMRLRTPPVSPKNLPYLIGRMKVQEVNKAIPDQWLSYLYWNVALDED